MIRILALSDVDPTCHKGGLERHLLEVYARLADSARAQIELVVVGRREDLQADRLPNVSIKFARGLQLKRFTGAQATFSPAVFKEVLNAASVFHPDVIHAHTLFFTSTLAGVLAARVRGIPLVTTMHLGSLAALPLHHRIPAIIWERTLGRIVLANSAHVICVSQDVAAHAERLGIAKNRLTVIPNSVDLREFTPADSDRNDAIATLITVGRLLSNKGNQYLIRALGKLPRTLEFRLKVVGEGPMESSLRRIAEEEGIVHHVEFTGKRDDVATLLRSADIFVRPSLTEGMSLSILEALASGLPVVASNTTGVRELISDGKEGLLVPPGDVPALARALGILIADSELRSRMAQAAIQKSLTLRSWDSVADDTLRVMYRSAAGRRGASR